MAWVLLLAPAARAQDEEILAREGDESATTTEQRQHSLNTLSTSARQASDVGDLLKAARYLNRAGRLQLRLNQPQDALASYQTALALLKRTPDPTIEVDSLNGMAAAYKHLSKCDEAQTFLQQATVLSDQSGYTAGKAEALLSLSFCQNYGDHALALRTAEESLALWQSINHRRGIAQSHTAISFYQMAQNNLTQAAQSGEAALSLWRELNVAGKQADALISLGYIEYRKGAWQNVLVFLTQAQDLIDEKAEPGKMGQITAGLAEAFIESGLPEVGLTKFNQALGYYRQTQNPRAITDMVLAIGQVNYILGNYPEALLNLQHALVDAEAIKEVKITAMCNDSLGQTYLAMNDHATALRYFKVALDLYVRVASPMEAARTRALMGQVYEQRGEIEKARGYYLKALETFRVLADQINQSATLYALGNLELKQSNLNAAEDYLRRSIEVTENMRRVSTSRDLTAAFSATVQERYESYVECLMRKHMTEPSQGLAVRAFEMSELARGRSLAELLRATGTRLAPGLDPQLAERERSLRQSLRAREDYKVQLLGGEYRRETLAAVEAELARLEAEYKQVNETIRARYPAYEQIARPVAWDLRRIQEQVVADDETVLLEYGLGAEKSYVWAVTRNSITSHELPARALINEAAQRVYQLLEARPGAETEEELTRAAHELSRMVLSPVADQLEKRRIIVVADGALNYIPFQLLPSPSADDEPLVAGHEVVNAPSASILGQLRQETERRQAPSKVLAAFGDPVFASDYALRKGTNGGGQLVASVQPTETVRRQHALRGIELNRDSFDLSVIQGLFYAKRELANLRDVAGGEEALVATDFDATRERLQSTDLTKFAILHFATHGFLDPLRPEYSGLLLSTVNRDGQAQEGFVGLEDIYNLHAPVELVVLSACRTALGKEVRGEGLIGLTRGFMYAGASSVVASLWKVDDEATAELMKRFYANMLQHGMTPAAGLRAAQNSIRREPKWRSPYYWAAFTLQGEYRRVIKPATAAAAMPMRPKLIAGTTLLTLSAGAGWWYRRRRKTRASRRVETYSTVKK